MKTGLWKNTLREFRFSRARFLSVTILVMLGVFVMVGLRSVGPDMRQTAQLYYQKHHLADAQLSSSLPLNATDRQQIRQKVKKVQHLEFVQQLDTKLDSTDRVIRLQTISPQLSRPRLTQGHLPRNGHQVLLNARERGQYHLGQTIRVHSGQAATLKTRTLQVVGFGTSAEYLDKSQLGVTPLGNGKVATFGYLSVEAVKKFEPQLARVQFCLKSHQAYDSQYEKQAQVWVHKSQPALNHLAKKKTQRIQRQLLQFQQLAAINPSAVNPQLEQQLRAIQAQGPIKYVFQTRNDYNDSYHLFGEDIKRIESLAQVFPYIFLAVALIVCFTTMLRMAQEKKKDLAVLSGLGYGRWQQLQVFLVYGLSAVIIGALVGAYFGNQVLTKEIYRAYGQSFVFPSLKLHFDLIGFTSVFLLSLLVIVLPSVVLAWRQSFQAPAELLQGQTVKTNSRIFLEYLPFLWRRFSFNYQITLRNIFRYKLRMLMTIIGVAGCTALLITGFGIRDSLQGLVYDQYTRIAHYDELAQLAPDLSSKEKETTVRQVRQQAGVKKADLVNSRQFLVADRQSPGNQVITFLSPATNQGLQTYLSLYNLDNQRRWRLPAHGVVITQKLAQSLNLRVHDRMSFHDHQGHQYRAPVAAIVQMSTGHYLFASPTAYRAILGHNWRANGLIVQNRTRTKQDLDQVARQLNQKETIVAVTRTDAAKKVINETLDSLQALILIIILVSSVLAYVVLYNLTNVNVLERVRELSTMKVLGFFDREVDMYIFRETILLTLVGIVGGFIGGKYLHNYIMMTVTPEVIMPHLHLQATNFLFSGGLTILFAVIVLLIMSQKIHKIDMLTALKSNND
ncbi:ABC transporter permease [Lactobacillus sp. DCY120]|uniref:ABC transporter permease n=1 Tax=Bombilactobacillus apium TaxID=2675299 RepID=A0A850R6Q3_9LACO|nr:ABC transporter permease [Bombilactobacillus apium]NVY96322.1 ABC transporter permease [Bombilactobacillus apium]